MNEINEILSQYLIFIIPTLSLIILILSIIITVMCNNQKKFRKRIERFLGTSTDKHNIENMLNDYIQQTKVIDEKHSIILDSIESINNRLYFCIQKVGLVRYNPFDDVGGDLSFSLALLNQDNDGIVINNLYSRDSCYTYAKPVKNGEAISIKFSDEEEKAIQKAITDNTYLSENMK